LYSAIIVVTGLSAKDYGINVEKLTMTGLHCPTTEIIAKTMDFG